MKQNLVGTSDSEGKPRPLELGEYIDILKGSVEERMGLLLTGRNFDSMRPSKPSDPVESEIAHKAMNLVINTLTDLRKQCETHELKEYRDVAPHVDNYAIAFFRTVACLTPAYAASALDAANAESLKGIADPDAPINT
jgi:hypothetical protein